MFFKKENRPVYPGIYEKFRFDPEEYVKELMMYRNQPWWILKELRTIKIIMAVLIPVFFIISFFSLPAACAAGVVPAAAVFAHFKKKRDIRPAVAGPVSVTAGVLFGFYFRWQISRWTGVFPL
jgi:hypothetical protein